MYQPSSASSTPPALPSPRSSKHEPRSISLPSSRADAPGPGPAVRIIPTQHGKPISAARLCVLRDRILEMLPEGTVRTRGELNFQVVSCLNAGGPALVLDGMVCDGLITVEQVPCEAPFGGPRPSYLYRRAAGSEVSR